jgi:hypothetical protein
MAWTLELLTYGVRENRIHEPWFTDRPLDKEAGRVAQPLAKYYLPSLLLGAFDIAFALPSVWYQGTECLGAGTFRKVRFGKGRFGY